MAIVGQSTVLLSPSSIITSPPPFLHPESTSSKQLSQQSSTHDTAAQNKKSSTANQQRASDFTRTFPEHRHHPHSSQSPSHTSQHPHGSHSDPILRQSPHHAYGTMSDNQPRPRTPTSLSYTSDDEKVHSHYEPVGQPATDTRRRGCCSCCCCCRTMQPTLCAIVNLCIV